MSINQIMFSRLVLIIACIGLIGDLSAQLVQLVQNGGFENGDSGFPNDIAQLDKCDFWGSSGTNGDWYTTLTFTGAFRGPCPFPGTNIPLASEIINAQPKIATHDGSNHYGGVGTSEVLTNELLQSTISNSQVKLGFWFSPRGPFVTNTDIQVRLRDNDNALQVNQLIIMTITDQFLPCQWYFIETEWIDTGEPEFDDLIIGGINNPAGDLFGQVYYYVDDITLLNGRDCCEPLKLYESTTNLPALTHKENFIKAGEDVGIPNISGPVIVQAGQNVIFKAGDFIELAPGFKTEPGATFLATIEDCNPATFQQVAGPIDIITFPNVFTPNGDNINDELCFNVNGATNYIVTVKNEFGTTVFAESGEVTANIVCVWDGTCNQPFPNCIGPSLSDGVYAVVIEFTNCDNEIDAAQFVQLLTGNGKWDGQDNSNDEIAVIPGKKEQQLKPFSKETYWDVDINPNPHSGVFMLTVGSQQLAKVYIYDVLGNLIYNSELRGKRSETIDISSHGKGVYMVRIVQGDQIFTERLIHQ